jgi:hypothetical protein
MSEAEEEHVEVNEADTGVPVFTETNAALAEIVAAMLGSWDDVKAITDVLVQCEESGFIKRYRGKGDKRESYKATVFSQKRGASSKPLRSVANIQAYREQFTSERCPTSVQKLFKHFVGPKQLVLDDDDDGKDNQRRNKKKGKKESTREVGTVCVFCVSF